MTDIVITKDDTGKLRGVGEKHGKAYAKFRKMVEEMEPGEIATVSFWFPRNPRLHGLHFAMLAALFDLQEQFADLDQMRYWLHVGAGHCEFVPGPKGKMVAIPKSIAFNRLDDEAFQIHHEKVKEFLRSLYATRFLWPGLSDHQASEMVEVILRDFEAVTL